MVIGVEDIMHMARMGAVGVSEGRCPDDPSEVAVSLDTAVRSVRVPHHLLAPEGAKPRSMKMWDKVSEEDLRGILGSVGVQDPRWGRLEEGPAMRLSMWAEWLLYGLQTIEDKLQCIVRASQGKNIWQPPCP